MFEKEVSKLKLKRGQSPIHTESSYLIHFYAICNYNTKFLVAKNSG